MDKEFWNEIFHKVFNLQIRQTFTAYLLYKIKSQVKEGMVITDVHYTTEGIEATVIDNFDKEKYLLTLKPIKTCEHKNSTNLGGVIGCNDCGKVL